MADATWTIAVDLSGNGSFADANEDVSAYVIAASWQLGMTRAYEQMARDATCTLVLRNSDKRFSPDSGSALANFTVGKVVRIQSTYSATTRTHYVGWIKSIKPAAGIYGPRTTVVECEGWLGRAQEYEVVLPVQESKRADQVIDTILSNTSLYPPGFVGWLLGVTGYSELGTTTVLSTTTNYFSGDTGKSTFNYIADQWANGTSVLGALRDVIVREFGRLYVDRSGVIQFWNRHHLIEDMANAADASFSGTMAGLEYDYGSDVTNIATVRYRPRSVSAAGTVLGKLTGDSIRIPAGGSKLVSIRYGDTSAGVRVAGKSATTPVQTTDYTAAANADGTGTDYTASVTATLTNEYATRSDVTFANSAGVDVYVIAPQIRGIRITDFGQASVTDDNDTSIATHGRRAVTYAGEMDNEIDARGVAEYIVSIRKDPIGSVNGLTLYPRTSDTLMTQGLARTIGDRIALTETQTGISATEYYIIGERWTVASGGRDVRIQWITEPAAAYRYWLLGVSGFSELGTTTTLGPL